MIIKFTNFDLKPLISKIGLPLFNVRLSILKTTFLNIGLGLFGFLFLSFTLSLALFECTMIVSITNYACHLVYAHIGKLKSAKINHGKLLPAIIRQEGGRVDTNLG